ncbi:hypothetical protein [Rhodococcus sp. 14-2496-1d]|uniref:hypothetical protein n=1 Tax=Rhodococcus sp. 14-2496-1d TaxID=2023146 RepID=UPI001179EB0B|nr:hypothetical protein [Rhodococcus sp. 14-2496-1d]
MAELLALIRPFSDDTKSFVNRARTARGIYVRNGLVDLELRLAFEAYGKQVAAVAAEIVEARRPLAHAIESTGLTLVDDKVLTHFNAVKRLHREAYSAVASHGQMIRNVVDCPEESDLHDAAKTELSNLDSMSSYQAKLGNAIDGLVGAAKSQLAPDTDRITRRRPK